MKPETKTGQIVIACVVVLCAAHGALAQVDWTWVGPEVVGRHMVGDVVFDGATYHMYLTSGPGNTAIENPWSVGHWTWNDVTLEWDPDPCNPVLEPEPGQWDSWSISGLAVRYDGASFHMWYGAYDGYHGPGHGGYATNADGYCDWDKYPGNPLPGLGPGAPGAWDEGGVWPSAVLFDGSTYHMWFGTGGGDPDPWAAEWTIGYATSTDGITWAKEPGPVLRAEATLPWEGDKLHSPEVVPMGGGFAMWYSGLSPSTASIGYAVSPDGVHWGKWPGNPMLTPQQPGSNGVDSIAVIAEGGVVHGWVSHSFGDVWRATSPFERIFFDGFENGDTTIWGLTIP